MPPIYSYNPYSNRVHPNSPLNMAVRELPAIDPPPGGWKILPEPESDPDYPGVIFVEVNKLKPGLSYSKLRRELRFLGSNPSRRIVVQLNSKNVSDFIIEPLQNLEKTLSEGKRNPYRENPPRLTGKLAVYTPLVEVFDELQNKGLNVFNSWDDAVNYASEDSQSPKDSWSDMVIDGEVKPNPEAVKALIDELSNKNIPTAILLSEKDKAFNKLVDAKFPKSSLKPAPPEQYTTYLNTGDETVLNNEVSYSSIA